MHTTRQWNGRTARGRAAAAEARPQLEWLEERALLSATPTVDLTTRGAEGAVGDAIFRQTDAQPTGTGYIKSFVRLQGRGGAAVEQGLNTDARPLQFDENSSPRFTRLLRLSEVPQVEIGGSVYLEFMLDINQSKAQPLLSLDELRVYVDEAPSLSRYDGATKLLDGRAAVYDLDAGGVDNWVKLNYSLNHGSGSGDVLFYVPMPAVDVSANPYVYLYSKFGEHLGANAGFEEWAVRTDRPSSLSGYVYVDANDDGAFTPDEAGIAGVVITLTGTDSHGLPVNVVVTTDENGYYNFGNLGEGTYRITEAQPAGYEDGQDTIGTQGGSVANDEFFDIVLLLGRIGQQNNFGELESVYVPPS